MKNTFQIICVLAFSVGAGFFAFGGYLAPRLDLSDPAQITNYLEHQSNAIREEQIVASLARGFGVALMTFGGLGLVVPWANAIVARIQQQRPDAAKPPDLPTAA